MSKNKKAMTEIRSNNKAAEVQRLEADRTYLRGEVDRLREENKILKKDVAKYAEQAIVAEAALREATAAQ